MANTEPVKDFNSVPFLGKGPNGVLHIPGFKGCCAGFMKFSYVISAPLHMKGFFAFWESDRATWADQIAVTTDLILHLATWFIALTLEIWCNMEKLRGHALLAELQTASLWGLIAALIGIVVAQLFAMTSGGQEVGRLFPTTYAAIVGGAYASIAFSLLWAITQVSVWPELSLQYQDDNANDNALQVQRQCMLWALALKIVAVVTLKKNASFWGPCTIDMAEENADRKSQYMKNMGITASGALSGV